MKLPAETWMTKWKMGSKSLRLKLSQFEEKKDEMDAYKCRTFGANCERLERRCMAVSLGSLLTGKEIKVYTSMPPEQAADNSSLKKAILKCDQFYRKGLKVYYFLYMYICY